MEQKIISFKQFYKAYSEHYKTSYIFIKDDSQMEDVVSDIYDADGYEINYDTETIELF